LNVYEVYIKVYYSMICGSGPRDDLLSTWQKVMRMVMWKTKTMLCDSEALSWRRATLSFDFCWRLQFVR